MGSVNDFINSFKTCIMDNYNLAESCTIQEKYAQLVREITDRKEGLEETKILMQNVEKAYMIIKQDLFGGEEEEWRLK
ncbi:hypothetical protein KDN24_11660 [Bacillus sp. Bva_UNVM-123]|uniref:hypothetical protein n=1 Tax=Bacillus sp. Bva_UNVM-123 TaxID=2829798 RepID=UPI00391EFFBF